MVLFSGDIPYSTTGPYPCYCRPLSHKQPYGCDCRQQSCLSTSHGQAVSEDQYDAEQTFRTRIWTAFNAEDLAMKLHTVKMMAEGSTSLASSVHIRQPQPLSHASSLRRAESKSVKTMAKGSTSMTSSVHVPQSLSQANSLRRSELSSRRIHPTQLVRSSYNLLLHPVRFTLSNLPAGNAANGFKETIIKAPLRRFSSSWHVLPSLPLDDTRYPQRNSHLHGKVHIMVLA